eukprot:TRINITY_DN1514_c0_g1_i1.p1 TRINITY_DN1514_c0_g1~~TRINITY_DN1514_c0_g1_i1.p1  ORF type:complete len:293 (-),score=125.97 TRINITY_DN1514_c0_g1_i1:95-973(-)
MSEISLKKVNFNNWIEQNKHFFQPPVCNKLLFADQLKVMFVGGPNVRKDYHLEKGEEIFYQVEGDMVVKIFEKNQPKDIVIKQGEIFLLRSHIPHSPQRQANTIGLVIERERQSSEIDGLRWYCEDGTNRVLYEEWFHCQDLGVQLKPVIERFFNSEQYRTGKPLNAPAQGAELESPPIIIDTQTELMQPISLDKLLENYQSQIRESGYFLILSGQEFQLYARTYHNQLSSKQFVHESETWLWCYKGNAIVTIENQQYELNNQDVQLIEKNISFSVQCSNDTICLEVFLQFK